jgi:hypothetical protein
MLGIDCFFKHLLRARSSNRPIQSPGHDVPRIFIQDRIEVIEESQRIGRQGGNIPTPETIRRNGQIVVNSRQRMAVSGTSPRLRKMSFFQKPIPCWKGSDERYPCRSRKHRGREPKHRPGPPERPMPRRLLAPPEATDEVLVEDREGYPPENPSSSEHAIGSVDASPIPTESPAVLGSSLSHGLDQTSPKAPPSAAPPNESLSTTPRTPTPSFF